MTETRPEDRSPPTRPCPICGKPATRFHAPFCSPRCADVDLNRWLSGHYAVPVTETDLDEGDSVEIDPRA